ncbi:MAG: hypothetical protein J2P15_15525, partial [Micromonosporaceae bacterium]|nr:hypothetical protein [Micromonosporaceae bacterium]
MTGPVPTPPAELIEAVEKALELPAGDGKIAELERLLARADAAGETRLSYDLRIALIQIYRNHHDQWRLV